jgi:tetratricopeptide (TPR) repeat protein
MGHSRKAAILGILLAAACAGGGGARSGASDFRQADHRQPLPQELRVEGERAEFEQAMAHVAKARELQGAGNADGARGEFRAAGEKLAALAEKYPSSPWRIVHRRAAAEFLLQGGDFAGAAKAAEASRQHAAATPATQAIAARIAAGSWQSLANAQARTGEIEPLRFLSATQRKEPPKPRTPPEPWQRFVDAADAYVANYKADPDARAPTYAPTLAFIAAQVQFAFDNLDDAARRFDAILTQFTGSDQAADAAQLYLETFLVRNDQEGHRKALAHVEEVVAKGLADAKASKEPDAQTRVARLEKIREQVEDHRRQAGFVEATALLNAGKQAEAAAAFERYVAENPKSNDAPNALYNAGIAYDRAGQPEKAQEVREKLVSTYPDSSVAGPALLGMASSRSRADQHREAAELYRRYLETFPQGENRCLALLNIGIELDHASQPTDAAKRYLDFANDPKCGGDDPDNTATLLFRAATFLQRAKQTAEYRAALEKLAALKDVKGEQPRSYVAEAQARLKKMR